MVHIKYSLYRADDVGCTLHNIDELKQGLVHVWDGMDQTIIDSAIDEWRGRLRACVRAKGGHFEQMLTFIKTLIIQQCDNKRSICDFVSISHDLHGSFM